MDFGPEPDPQPDPSRIPNWIRTGSEPDRVPVAYGILKLYMLQGTHFGGPVAYMISKSYMLRRTGSQTGSEPDRNRIASL